MSRFLKAVRILSSDLAIDEKLRYLYDAVRRKPSQAYALRGGGRISLRPNTTDAKVFDEVFIDRIYNRLLPDAKVRTIADLGANTGLSTIALLRAFPRACAVAVEPDRGNYEAMLENLKRGGVADRCLAVRGFVGASDGMARIEDPGYGEWGLRMGERALDGIPVYTLPSLAARGQVEGFDLVKCDIEGSERELFSAIEAWDFLVQYMILELHADLYPVESFEASLDRSAFEWTVHGAIAEATPLSVIAIERGAAQRERSHVAAR